MIHMGRNSACLCLLLCFPILALAQDEDEGIALRSGTVQTTTRVRYKPSINQRILTTLQPNTKIRIVNPEPRRGFYRVILPKGRQGYVWAQNVQLEQPSLPVDEIN